MNDKKNIFRFWTKPLIISLAVYSLYCCISLIFSFASHDESHYLVETARIYECFRNGLWIGNEPVGSHGFLMKIPAALLYLIFGRSVLLARITGILFALISFALCYRLLNKLLKSEKFALAGTFMVFFNPIVSFCALKYLRDVPAMCMLLLFFNAVIDKRKSWVLGILLLLVLDAKEYLFIVLLPPTLAYIFFDEIFKFLKVKGERLKVEGNTQLLDDSTTHNSTTPGTASQVISEIQNHKSKIQNKSTAYCLLHTAYYTLARSLAILAPGAIYLLLMLYTSAIPINNTLVTMLGLTKSGFGRELIAISIESTTQTSIGKAVNLKRKVEKKKRPVKKKVIG